MPAIPVNAHDAITSLINNEEGGFIYTDRKNDLDHGTFAGVRYMTYSVYVEKLYGEQITSRQFKMLAHEQPQEFIENIYDIYYTEFYEPCEIRGLNGAMVEMLFSCAVNTGPGNCGKILQRTYNIYANGLPQLVVDGHVGPNTRKQLSILITNNTTTFAKFRNTFVDEWIRYYINIVQANSLELVHGTTQVNQAMNLEGWFNRANSFRYKG